MSSAARSLLLLSGPNLNLFGSRQPEIYGTATLDDMVELARGVAAGSGWELRHLQSNHEGVLIDAIHEARGTTAAIVINAGAFTHYAWALHDALSTYDGVVVELHVSNPAARESWRHVSVISSVATAVIAGAGVLGYDLAVRAAIGLVDARDASAPGAAPSAASPDPA